MSLINDVLRDLERRRGDVAIRPAHATTTITRRGSLPRWPIWVMVAVAAGIALHWFLEPMDESDARPDRLRASMESVPGGQARQPQATRSGPTVSADANEQAVAEAPVAFERGKARPDRQEARVEDAIRQSSGGSDAEPTAARDQRPEAQARASQPAAPRTNRGQAATSRAAAASSDARSTAPQISIQRSRPGNDRLDKARRAYADGRPGIAEAHLREVIESTPHSTEAFELLATILLHRQRGSEAESLLERGLESAGNPHQLALLLGRLRLEHGETAGAIEVLSEHAPEMDEAADHHLLLALAHRQAGDHAAAAEIYRRLSAVTPGRARVWLGLGVSLEALARFEEAATAYRRAAAGDDPQATRFARQRLAAIERRGGDS